MADVTQREIRSQEYGIIAKVAEDIDRDREKCENFMILLENLMEFLDVFSENPNAEFPIDTDIYDAYYNKFNEYMQGQLDEMQKAFRREEKRLAETRKELLERIGN